MTWTNYAVLGACVLAIASGQLLFKLSAGSAAAGGWRGMLSPMLLAALAIYGVATLAWVWQLRTVALSRAYPLMALSFVIVPLLSMLLLDESVDTRYWAGTALIVMGIVLTLP